MPFDNHDYGGGGGGNGDDHHKGIPTVAAASLDAVGILAKSKGLCLDCMALQMASASLALFFLQQEVVNKETGEPDIDGVQSLLQVVMDFAMREIAITVEARKAGK